MGKMLGRNHRFIYLSPKGSRPSKADVAIWALPIQLDMPF